MREVVATYRGAMGGRWDAVGANGAERGEQGGGWNAGGQGCRASERASWMIWRFSSSSGLFLREACTAGGVGSANPDPGWP